VILPFCINTWISLIHLHFGLIVISSFINRWYI
jgi:hypothetical protein